jgi:hypothetical protein
VDILTGVNPLVYPKVLDSIRKDGLRFPILLVQAPAQYVVDHFDKLGLYVPEFFLEDREPDQIVLVPCGGGNRAQAAKDLGYTGISAAMFYDFPSALNWQHHQREPYASWWDHVPGGWDGKQSIQINTEGISLAE